MQHYFYKMVYNENKIRFLKIFSILQNNILTFILRICFVLSTNERKKLEIFCLRIHKEK